MKADQDARIVIHRLQTVGYTAEPIRQTESAAKSADLWAQRGNDRLVVEVKSRVDDKKTAKTVRRQPVGVIVEREGTLGRKNRLSRVVEEAARQIRSSQRQHSGLGILWFRAIPEFGFDDSEEQLIATLLGVRHGSWKRGEDWGFTTIYAADYSDFFRFRSLDAAVLEVAEDRGRLVINPYSPRKAELEQSRLYSFFAKDGAVLDIDRLEPPKAFVLRRNVDRRDQQAVWKALCDEYPEYRFAFSEPVSWGSVVQVRLPKGTD